MFSKHEASQIRQQFWTSFGQYMAPVPGASGEKINWVNYKTGIKDLHFTMQADKDIATIEILIAQRDTDKQAAFFNQFKQLQSLLHQALQEEWQWVLHVPDENNKTVSRMYTSLRGVNLYNKENWPAIISFFKPRMIALDAFWYEAKDGFLYF